MKVICTIELLPFTYAIQEHQSPNGSAIELPTEWEVYWHNSISDSGLGKLTAIRSGSFLVDITTIDQEELKIILQKELEDITWEDYREEIGKLSGGLVLIDDKGIQIEPMCCGDIGDFAIWERIFETPLNQWTQLWIGHPWIYYRRKEGRIAFSEYTEKAIDLAEIKTVYTVDENELREQIAILTAELTAFTNRIALVLLALDIPHAVEVANMLVGRMKGDDSMC